jgi:CRP-like cAMP-binding protein
MPIASPPLAGNNLFASLPGSDQQRVLAQCESVELQLNETVVEANASIQYVYFPTTAYVSLITPKGAADSVEVGMVGSEGMLGASLLLDVRQSPLVGLVQGAGKAYRIKADIFTGLVNEITSWRNTLNRYFYFLTQQIAQTAACNRFHSVDARLARWLLMTADRAHGTRFKLTHEFLAYMLGARRAGITEAAGRLQDNKLIQYSRGNLTVLDHKGLKDAACPCYAALNDMYAKSVGVVQRNTLRPKPKGAMLE